jgi:signal transduction histidine kinase
LNQVALALTDMLAPTLAPAITMRLDLGTNMPPCQVAPDHLETALLNLVMNAREAMPDGGTINLSTASS